MSVLFWAKRIAVIGALALGGTAVVASAAAASTVTFDFTGGPSVKGTTLSFSAGALDLLVSASHFVPATGAITGGGKVTQTDAGLGERTGALDDTAKLDGNGRKELLVFSFSSRVTIESVTFLKILGGSKVTGFVDGVMLGKTAVHPFMDVSAFDLTAYNFGIGAGSAHLAFRIASITVATVPVPAGGMLLGGALLGLSRLRRKTRA